MTINLMQALNMRQNPQEYKTNKGKVDRVIETAIKNIQHPSHPLPNEIAGKVEKQELLEKFNAQERQRIGVNIRIRNYKETYSKFPNESHNAEMAEAIKTDLAEIVRRSDAAEASKTTASKYKTAAKIVGGLAILLLAVAAVAVTLIFAAPIVAVSTLIITAAVAGAATIGFALVCIHLIQKANAYNLMAEDVGGADEARQFLNEIRPFNEV